MYRIYINEEYISLGHPHAPAPSMLHPTSDMDWRLEFPFSQIIPPSPSPSEGGGRGVHVWERM